MRFITSERQRNLSQNLQKLFHVFIYNTAEKSDALADAEAPAEVPEQVLSKEKTLVELRLENLLATPATKKETENPSGEVIGYLLLGIGGLAVSAPGVHYQGEPIMATLW